MKWSIEPVLYLIAYNIDRLVIIVYLFKINLKTKSLLDYPILKRTLIIYPAPLENTSRDDPILSICRSGSKSQDVAECKTPRFRSEISIIQNFDLVHRRFSSHLASLVNANSWQSNNDLT